MTHDLGDLMGSINIDSMVLFSLHPQLETAKTPGSQPPTRVDRGSHEQHGQLLAIIRNAVESEATAKKLSLLAEKVASRTYEPDIDSLTNHIMKELI